MQRIVMAWAALSLGMVASPLAAQQAGMTPAAIETRYLQSVPPAPPPPRARYVAPKPPPFPPMPKVQPHKRSTKAATRHSSHTSRKAKPARHLASKPHRTTSKHAKTVRPAKVHLSKKTIRQCHGISYKQIMAHRYCRALMQQEISAANQQHKAVKRHRAATQRHSKKRTSAKRKRS